MRFVDIRRRAVLALTGAFLLRAQPATGITCDTLQAVPGSTGYQQRSNSDRCEGLYQTPVSGERLEFLSFSAGPLAYDLANDKILTVAVPNVGRLNAPAVEVRATSLQLGVYYRMDAQVGSASAIDWPLDTVIAPNALAASSIGIVGWVNSGGSRVYVPVSVYGKAKTPPARGPVTAVFRSNVDIESLRWRVIADGATAQGAQWSTLRRSIQAGTPIPVSFNLSPQLQRLEVVAKIANSDDKATELYRVFDP